MKYITGNLSKFMDDSKTPLSSKPLSLVPEAVKEVGNAALGPSY